MEIFVGGKKENDVLREIYVRIQKCQQLHISKLFDVVFAAEGRDPLT